MFDIQLDEDTVRAGESISGRITIKSNNVDSTSSSIEIKTKWNTEGNGSEAWGTPSSKEYSGGTSGITEQKFELTIPGEGPISYSGKHVTVVWEILVQSTGSSNEENLASRKFEVLP